MRSGFQCCADTRGAEPWLRKRAGGEAGLEMEAVRRIVQVWVQAVQAVQHVSGDDTADTAHTGIHVSQRQGFWSSKGWSQLCGDGRGPRA
jgi:hypothetical protein